MGIKGLHFYANKAGAYSDVDSIIPCLQAVDIIDLCAVFFYLLQRHARALFYAHVGTKTTMVFYNIKHYRLKRKTFTGDLA